MVSIAMLEEMCGEERSFFRRRTKEERAKLGAGVVKVQRDPGELAAILAKDTSWHKSERALAPVEAEAKDAYATWFAMMRGEWT